MKFFVSIFILIAFTSGSLSAQTDSVYYGGVTKPDTIKRKQEKDYEWLKKVTYGGNLQLQLGTYTFIYLSPTLGYSPIKKLNVGLGFIYNYASINYGAPYGKISQSVYGGHSYARYFVTDEIFVQGQYDKLRQPNVFSSDPGKKTWVDYVLVGVGFRKPLGERVGLSGTVLYNLTPNDLSIYPSRFVIQFGFMGSF